MSKAAEKELKEFAKTDTYQSALKALVGSLTNSFEHGVAAHSVAFLSAMERAQALLGRPDLDLKERVVHPNYYNMGGPKEADGTAKYETIKIIEDWSLGFCLGNALKYILRAPYKGAEAEDLAKARWYLQRGSDFVDDYGPEFSILVAEVVSAWDLPKELTWVVSYIHKGDAKNALRCFDEYLLARAESGR